MPTTPDASRDFSIILAEDDRLPEGAKQIDATVYLYDGEIVVLGSPQDLDHPEATHSCDAMGCGSIGPHVIARVGTTCSGFLEQAAEDAKLEPLTPRDELRCRIRRLLACPPGFGRCRIELQEAAKRYFGSNFSA